MIITSTRKWEKDSNERHIFAFYSEGDESKGAADAVREECAENTGL